MEVVKLGIILKDKAFAKALVRGISRECGFIEIDISDNLEGIDLFITDTLTDKENHIQLVNSLEEEMFDQPPFRIFKYRESRSLVKGLLFVFYKLTGHIVEFRGDYNSYTIGFCQTCGGLGATSLSLLTGKGLNEIYGKNSIYISLDSIDDSVKYIGREMPSSIIKLIYYLSNKKDFPIENFINLSDYNCDYIGGYGVLNPISEATTSQLFSLVRIIESLGKYQAILFDIGKNISSDKLDFIRKLDLLVVIFPGEKSGLEDYYNLVKKQFDDLKINSNILFFETAKNACNNEGDNMGMEMSQDIREFLGNLVDKLPIKDRSEKNGWKL